MSATCQRCLGPLAPEEVHDSQVDCDLAAAAGGVPIIPRGNSAGELLVVPIDQVTVADNVRTALGDLDELAASIRSEGLLQPIMVHRADAAGVLFYVVDHGHRRLAACKLAGLTEIPVIVSAERQGVDRPIAQLVENLQRADLNPLEEAEAFRGILAEMPALTQKALADRLGRSAPYVSNALRLLELDPEVRAMLGTGEIAAAHGKAMVGLPAKQQQEIARRVKDGLSSHSLEQEIKYKRLEAESQEHLEKTAAKMLPRVMAVIEASGLAKTTPIQVHGDYYLTKRVDAALRDQGWTGLTLEYLSERPAEGKCDCTAVRLEIGRKAVLVPACVDRRHRDRQQNVDHQARQAEEDARTAQVAELRAAVQSVLGSLDLGSGLMRLIAFMATEQYRRNWADIAALDPDALFVRVLDMLTSQWGVRAVDLPALIAELTTPVEDPGFPEPISAAEAAERVGVKRAARRAKVGADG